MPLDVATTLDELRRLERELAEHDVARREHALAQVRDAVTAIGEVGSPAGILDRAADVLGGRSELDRVLISRVRDGHVEPHAIWERDGAARALDGLGFVLAYPLVEAEVAQRQTAQLVEVARAGRRAPASLTAAFGWSHYAVAALTLDGATVGLLHADAAGRAVDELDREVAERYANGVAEGFAIAALRDTLGRLRDEQRAAVRWISGRLDRAERAAPAAEAFSGSVADALTPREREVIELLAKGMTNRAISHTLVIGEGTVKYHVKNVLRKLRATTRADAVARYLRSGAG